MFRQAFLLSQYSFICVQYFKWSGRIIYAIFFWQLINKRVDCFNNIVFILVVKISSNKVYENIEHNSTLEKVFLVCNRNAELLQLLGATFDSKVAFLRRMRKKNLIIVINFAEKSLPFFVWVVKYQVKVFGNLYYAHWACL